MAFRLIRDPEAFSHDLSASKKKRPREKKEAHLAYVRRLPCLLTGRRGVDAAHIRYADPRFGKRKVGIGEKPDDKWTVPLHRDVHIEQHEQNERAFWQQKGIDPLVVAAALFAVSGDVEQGELIISQHRRTEKEHP